MDHKVIEQLQIVSEDWQPSPLRFIRDNREGWFNMGHRLTDRYARESRTAPSHTRPINAISSPSLVQPFQLSKICVSPSSRSENR